MAWLPIQNYGVIGDLHTVALVGTNGSIDWWCSPRFDSPSVFAAILDDDKGGRFQVQPTEPCTCKQLYLPDTNVLVTRFLASDGVAEVTDFMPVRDPPPKTQNASTPSKETIEHKIVRKIELVRGTMRMLVTCTPAFDYARAAHTSTLVPEGAVFATPALGGRRLALASSIPLALDNSGVRAEVSMKEGDVLWLELYHLGDGEAPRALSHEALAAGFTNTVRYWRRWLSTGQYSGRWREMVNRSALCLKLLTYQPTGAIVAAPTTSLPEQIGGVRNWDYRYTWIRDASFTLYGLLRVGFTEEAVQFMEWLTARLKEVKTDGLSILYPISGESDLTEHTLTSLGGYQGSAPVRVGNGAATQLQLDITGELMDAVYLYNKHVQPIGYDMWNALRPVVDWVCDHWSVPDEGIWEVRGGRRHFVYSKVMCWVAIDRALRLADKRSFPAPRARWMEVRDAIYEDVMAKGWNPTTKTFVQSYGSTALDAANLIMPLVFFVSPTDPRMLATLDATMRELVSDSLVARYNGGDGLPGEEGTFSICTFWLVEALTRAGRVDEARLIFEKMLTYGNHVGLFSEEIGRTGEALGNFPQALTHLGLISAAYNLSKALDAKGRP